MFSDETIDLLKRIYLKIAEVKKVSRYVYLRGQSFSGWDLKPKISRPDYKLTLLDENNLFIDFKSRSELIVGDENSWNVLFRMQHYGLPTRLLDWSESLNVSLFFASEGKSHAEEEGAVWILNPFIMNGLHLKTSVVPIIPFLEGGVEFDYFQHIADVSKLTKLEPPTDKYIGSKVIAILPRKTNPRMLNQQAAFTLHENLDQSMEDIQDQTTRTNGKKYLEKIVISPKIKEEIREMLKLGGVDEFSLFPDIEGLANQLNKKLKKK